MSFRNQMPFVLICDDDEKRKESLRPRNNHVFRLHGVLAGAEFLVSTVFFLPVRIKGPCHYEKKEGVGTKKPVCSRWMAVRGIETGR